MESHRPPDAKSLQDVHALYARCCSDDPIECNGAFQELGRFLLRVAYARLRSQPYLTNAAEDCVQQALMIVWRKLRAGSGPERPEWFMTWSASIVIHRLLDESRKVTRARADSLEEITDADESQLPAQAGSDAAVSGAIFATTDDRKRFVAMIEDHPRLSADVKFVLLRGYLLEQDDQELAQQLGKSQTTVRVLRFRGLKALRSDPEFMAAVMALTHAEPVRISAAAGT
jgi:RNA polymerase sigma factor (sigma-70 family)